MDGLQVSADGLRALAGRCESLAEHLARCIAPKIATASDQATVAAVSICDERIAAAGAALAAWVSATAATLSTSANAYGHDDTTTASALDTRVL